SAFSIASSRPNNSGGTAGAGFPAAAATSVRPARNLSRWPSRSAGTVPEFRAISRNAFSISPGPVPLSLSATLLTALVSRSIVGVRLRSLGASRHAAMQAGFFSFPASGHRHCMSADNERFTLDTNLLVYAIDNAAGVRHDAAGQIIQHAVRVDCWLTLQAVSEFYAVVTRKGIVQPPDAAPQPADCLDLFPSAAASQPPLRS